MPNDHASITKLKIWAPQLLDLIALTETSFLSIARATCLRSCMPRTSLNRSWCTEQDVWSPAYPALQLLHKAAKRAMFGLQEEEEEEIHYVRTASKGL